MPESLPPTPGAPLSQGAFGRKYFPRTPRSAAASGLHVLLTSADHEAPLAERVDWLCGVARWLRPQGLAGLQVHAQASTARLRILREALRDVPAWCGDVARLVAATMRDSGSFAFFAETGTSRMDFVGEAIDRVARRIVPTPPDDASLGETLARMFCDEDDVEWLEAVPSELVAELWALLEETAGADFFEGTRADLADALSVVALRAAARGFADDIRARMPATPVRESPFMALAPACEALLAARGGDDAARAAARDELTRQVGACRRGIAAVVAHIEDRGVSVDLVYRLELIGCNLDRILSIAELLAPRGRAVPAAQARVALDLVADLLRQRHESRSLTGLFHASMRQFARKVVERTGDTGEHYITATAREWRGMLASAAGGGAVTALAVLVKFLAKWTHLPPLIEASAFSLNYASAFVTIHLAGFTLATKQPSATAATLAGSIKQAARTEDLSDLAELVARLTRSQLAAAVGNLGVVVPTALLLDAAVRLSRGSGFLSVPDAQYAVESLRPFASLSLPFAALTGFLLWLGAVAAGWVENWWVYRRLPEAIAGHRGLVRLAGAARAQRIADFLTHNVPGVWGNVTLGVLLGCVPFVGQLFGMTLDVRHVTFAAGSLAFALATLGPSHLLTASGLGAVAGLGLILLLNFGVSFMLALWVALRAREVRHRLRIVPALLARFRQAPRDFLLPPRAVPPPAKSLA